ncbi:MAG: Gfo/Idh/MocA family oxidoreductase [Lentisphaeria bacterium]|nr:Gfo/Idh/MocA family oxidoreductase [Lentisphaeria bacterium]
MKIVLVGCFGHIGYVFRGLERVPSVEIAAVASGSEAPADVLTSLCLEHGQHPVVYRDWQQMFDEVQPDVACIDGPFDKHAEMAAYALAHGIHVFCEKPIALDFAQLAMVRSAWLESGKHIRSMVGLRYADAFLHAYKLVDSGAVGKIKFIRTQKSYKLGRRPDFYKVRKSYGGTIPWVGSHAVDWIMFYSQAAFSAVTAYHDADDNCGHGDLEMVGHALFKMDNGVIADAGIDYLRPAAASTHGDDRVRIAGTSGVLEVRGGKIYLINGDGEQEIVPPPADRDVFSDFILELTTGRPALVTDAQTFALTYAVLLARESADRGKTLEFTGFERS